jgi:hypothetical protein
MVQAIQTLSGATMGLIKLLAAPIRSIARFPLFQLAVVVFVIFVLQAADDKSAFGQLFNGLDKTVDLTVTSLSAVFNVKSFTKSLLTFSFMIAYVYVPFFLILALTRFLIRIAVDLVGQSNAFWLRNTIARERGIAAYRAWVPFDKIRRLTLVRKNGRRDLLGPPTTNHHTLHWRNEWYADWQAMWSYSWLSLLC